MEEEGGRGVQHEESPEQCAQREVKERKVAEKYNLFVSVREQSVLFDMAPPDHLNNAITSILWYEIGSILHKDGK